jgi:hypothetical protein
MNRQINKRWQSLLLVTIVAVIMLGVSSPAAFGQKSSDKFPKPDFSAMEEYWEVVEYEYDFINYNIPRFFIIAKKKVEKAPLWWDITWYDAKGVKIDSQTFRFFSGSKVGEPARSETYAPWKRQMPQVKKVVVTENEEH